MAEVIGLAVSAAQTGEYCLKLCNLVERVYYASTSMRRHQQRIQELQALLAQILQDPIFHTPEIAGCTTALSNIIKSINIPEVIRKRDRLIYSIGFVLKERHFNELFGCIEEKKSTLALYIAHVNKSILDDLRTELKHSHILGCSNATSEEKKGDCKMETNPEDYLTADITNTLEHEQIGRPVSARLSPLYQQPTYAEGQLIVCRNGIDASTSNFSSDASISRSEQFSESQPDLTVPGIAASYSSNLHTGAGTQHNGPQISSAVRAKDELYQATQNMDFSYNCMGPGYSEEEEGWSEKTLRKQKYRQINGPVFEPGARAEKVGGNYSNNVMRRNGDQFNGPCF